VPARSTLVASVLALAAVVAALTFATNLDRFLETPRRFGVNWDARVGLGAEDPDDARALQRDVSAILRDDPSVSGWSEAAASRVELEGHTVPAIAIRPIEGDVLPTVIDGRIPERDNEIALGTRTLERFELEVGDTVLATFRSTRQRLHIVGRVALPGAGNYPGGDKTAVGDGAVLTTQGLEALSPSFGDFRAYLVRFRPGADPEVVRTRLDEKLGRLDLPPETAEVVGVEKPADVVDYERVRATPLVLAGMLALLGNATITHALATTVRRRRRDLALLKALGFTRGQVSSTVAWQASAVAVIALVVGVPIGVAAGRLAWTLLAQNIGTIAEPATPLLVVALAVPGALVLTNVVAAIPAWLAARTNAAAALRAE